MIKKNNYKPYQQRNSFIQQSSLSSTPSTTRQRVDKFCPACGIYGHDVFANGCDFTASVIKALDFLKKHPNLRSDILKHHFQHQGSRKRRLQQFQKTSSKFQSKAVQKNFKYGPKVKMLMDIVGESMDELLHDAPDPMDGEDIYDLSEEDNDEFQDPAADTDHEE